MFQAVGDMIYPKFPILVHNIIHSFGKLVRFRNHHAGMLLHHIYLLSKIKTELIASVFVPKLLVSWVLHHSTGC
jgi:hypothetical protein